MIREKATKGNYVMKRELLNSVDANFHANLTYDWIRCFLERRADFLSKASVAPGELPKFQGGLDEIGLSDWEESVPKPILVQPF
jgi:hypothetical protein